MIETVGKVKNLQIHFPAYCLGYNKTIMPYMVMNYGNKKTNAYKILSGINNKFITYLYYRD